MRRADLVESLATVAIAALSGPLGGVGVAVATQIVRISRKDWDRQSPERHLRDAVRESLEAWAGGEGIEPATVDRGLGWAVEYVQTAGTQYDVIADAQFDPHQAAAAVLDRVKQSDRYWGTEVEYTIAAAAVEKTYAVLCAALKSEGVGGAVLAAVQSSRRAVLASIQSLRDEFFGIAGRDELIGYLQRKVRDWDFSPFTLGRSPSELERALRIDTRGVSGGDLVDATTDLGAVGLLVVLGGPGSGKSWRARRYAREAARAAVEQLKDPRVDVRAVEIPVFTTAAAWAAQPATGLDGVIAAGAATAGDDRVRRFVRRRGAHVLAVVDSLDEAAVGENAIRTLMRSLEVPPGWRVILTSRPEAWHSASPALASTDDVTVGHLTPLDYPNDVVGFVRSWFRQTPAVAEHLLRQLDTRVELRNGSSVPLLLTFYCMLTDQQPDKELPASSRDLYRRVIDLLLSDVWSDGARVDFDSCREILQRWAWDAVKDAVNVVGLGAWPDQFVTRQPPEALTRALDNVAPKQQYPLHSQYDRQQVERRFLHRTLMEYLVAEHISTLPAPAAAEILLPHLWLDPDWAATVPLALAAHPDRDIVLDLLVRNLSPNSSPLEEVVVTTLQHAVLGAAAQTEPSDWNARHRTMIDDIRITVAGTRDSSRLIGSVHWAQSNLAALRQVLASLPTVGVLEATDLLEIVPILAASSEDRVSAVELVVAALDAENIVTFPGLVRLLPTLGASAGVLENVVSTVLAALPNADSMNGFDSMTALELASLLPVLEASAEDKAAAIPVVLAALRTAHRLWVPDLIQLLDDLGATSEDRSAAINALLEALSSAHPNQVPDLVQQLTQLGMLSPQERTAAVRSVLASIDMAEKSQIPKLCRLLPPLEASSKDRASAIAALTPSLPRARHFDVAEMVRLLAELGASDEDRAAAVREAIGALPTVEPLRVEVLVNFMLELGTSSADRAAAVGAVTARLHTVAPDGVGLLAGVLQTLDASQEERATAVTAAIAALPIASPATTLALVGILPALGATEEELSAALPAALDALPQASALQRDALEKLQQYFEMLARARPLVLGTLLEVFGSAEPFEMGALGELLVALGASTQERSVAIELVVAAISTVTNPELIPGLVALLSTLNASAADRAAAGEAIMTVAGTCDPYAVQYLVELLPGLDPSDEGRSRAVDALMATVPSLQSSGVPRFVEALSTLQPSPAVQALALRTVLDMLPADRSPEVTRAVLATRALAPIQEWLKAISTPGPTTTFVAFR